MTWGERCDVCGWCATPGRCVWSVTCPRCEAAPGDPCRTPSTNRLEGLHAERWEAVGLDYRATADLVAEAPTPGSGTTGATVYTIADWEDLIRVEEYLDEPPPSVDWRAIDSLTDLQRATEEATV